MTSDSDEMPLTDQVAEDYLERLRRGEQPTIDEYVARHPQIEAELRDLLPTLQFLEDFKPSDGDREPRAEPEPVTVPAPLEQVGEYRILKEIGRGGMGVVYEAEQLSLGRHVALKILPKRAVRDDVAIERFQREARAAAKLQHPNIVPIIDIGSEGDVNYYAMQFVRGRSLNEIQDNVRDLRGESAVPQAGVMAGKVGESERIDTSTMGGRQYWRSVARIGVQVSRALAYAHDRGVIHRDIKPSNLLLDDEGTLWVTDFGLAKTDDDGLTLTGDVVGTIRYMSPERFKGQCDERADVFSVGATLYEMLVLEPAFHSPDRLRLIERITKEDPSNPRSIDPSVPVDLETIVLKSLEKDPRRRYQSAKELCDDLSRFLSHQPIRARRTSAFGRALRWAARNRALAITATCLISTLLAVAVAAIALAFHMGELADDATSARATIERQLYRSQVQSAVSAIETGRVGLARQRLHETVASLRGWEWRHVESRLERGIGSPLPEGLRVTSLQFAADGALALLQLVNADGSRLYRVADTVNWRSILDVPADPTATEVVLTVDGAELVLVGRELKVWNVQRQELVHQSADPPKYFAGSDTSSYLHPTASNLQRRVRATGEETGRIEGPPWWSGVRPGGDHVLVMFRRSVGLFSMGDLTEVGARQEMPASGYLESGFFSRDGNMVSLTSAGGAMYLFSIDADGLVPKHELTGYVGGPTCGCFSTDGRFVVLGTTLGRIYVWDTETGEMVRQLDGHQAPVFSVAVNAKTDVLVSCDTSGGHRGWSFEANSFDVLRGHASYVYPVAYSHDGQRIISGGWDGFQNKPGSLRWWDALTGDAIVARIPAGQFVPCLVSAPGNRIIAVVTTAAGSAGVVVCDELTGEVSRTFTGHGSDQVVRVYMHPDGQRVLSLGAYEYAMLWDIDSGQVERKWRHSHDGTNGQVAAFSPDGNLLALNEYSASVHLIDVSSGEEITDWVAHNEHVTDLAFSADGQTLISSSNDDSIALWNLDGTLRARLTGHGVDVMCLAVSPDGARIASGGRDGDLLLWDVEHFDLVARFPGHSDYIYDCAWSPDGERIVTTSGDGTLRLWMSDTMANHAGARRERARMAARLTPVIASQVEANSSLGELAPRWLGDQQRSAREREVAYQLLMRQSARKD